jgi:membrane protein YdbS with pleckstrin-like domain
MLTQDEKNFLDYWEKNREKEKNILHQLKIGLPLGLLIGIGIIINFISGWYRRANMVAFTQSTPLVLFIAIIIIIIFCSVFYNRHKWEMKDQRYQILSKRKDLEIISNEKQQDEQLNGQID